MAGERRTPRLGARTLAVVGYSRLVPPGTMSCGSSERSPTDHAIGRFDVTIQVEPMRGALVATVRRRALVTHRIDEARAAALLPAGMEPITVDGHALVSLCYSDIRKLRPRGTPTAIGISFQYLVTRMLVRVRPRSGSAFVAAHVLEALADSRLARVGARLVYRLAMRPARIELHDEDGSWQLRARVGDEDLLQCTLRSSAEAEAFEQSVFPGMREAFATMLSMTHGTHVGARSDRARVLSQTFDPHTIGAGRASGRTLSGTAGFDPGETTLDHVLMGYDVPYRYSALARTVQLGTG
jgi:hypothetical protein